MDTFKYTKSDKEHIYIEFVVDGLKMQKRFDIRYVPTVNVEDFNDFCEKYIAALKRGNENDPSFVSKEIIGKK